ncbi:hypothetical protein [Solidesulfovibrio sp.]
MDKAPLEQAEARILELEAEVDRLAARLAGTVYDGTPATLPPNDGPDKPIQVKRSLGAFGTQYFSLFNFEHSRLAAGDRWWPFPGGGE